METQQKSGCRHAVDRFVWNESGRTQYAILVQTMDGLQLKRHPVNTRPLEGGGQGWGLSGEDCTPIPTFPLRGGRRDRHALE